MIIESLDSIVEKIFFWGGLALFIISFLYVILVRPNSKGVFQLFYGKWSLQPDKAVGNAMLTTVLSTISMSASWELVYVLWGILASAGFLLIAFFIHDAYWRAFKKSIIFRLKDFWNWIETIFGGKTRKE